VDGPDRLSVSARPGQGHWPVENTRVHSRKTGESLWNMIRFGGGQGTFPLEVMHWDTEHEIEVHPLYYDDWRDSGTRTLHRATTMNTAIVPWTPIPRLAFRASDGTLDFYWEARYNGGASRLEHEVHMIRRAQTGQVVGRTIYNGISGSATSYRPTSKPPQRPVWQVRVRNSKGWSAWSAWLPLRNPSAFSLSARQTRSGAVQANWGNLPSWLTPHITHIHVSKGIPGQGYDQTVAVPWTPTVRAHRFDGLTVGTEYIFSVQFAVKGSGDLTPRVESNRVTVQY